MTESGDAGSAALSLAPVGVLRPLAGGVVEFVAPGQDG